MVEMSAARVVMSCFSLSRVVSPIAEGAGAVCGGADGGCGFVGRGARRGGVDEQSTGAQKLGERAAAQIGWCSGRKGRWAAEGGGVGEGWVGLRRHL
jgi:hypothetical protein